MGNVFVSYSRQSEERVHQLIADIESLGHQPWFDRELSGGQSWWDRILEQIRSADVFVIAVDAHSLDSDACKREYTYAEALGVPILPVVIGPGVSANLLPHALSRLQYVDYTDTGRDAAFRLARAFNAVPPRPAPPTPLPVPPDPPMSYLGTLAERISSPEALTQQEQSSLVLDLKHGLRDPATRRDAELLLLRFRERRDLYKFIDVEIDDALGSIATSPPKPAAEDRPKPAARPQPEAPSPAPAPAQPAQGVGNRIGAALLLGSVGSVLGGLSMITAVDVITYNGNFNDEMLFGLLTGLGLAIAGLLCGSNTSRLWFAIRVAVGCGIIGAAAFAMEDPESSIAIGTVFCAPAGAVLGALLWPAFGKRKAG